MRIGHWYPQNEFLKGLISNAKTKLISNTRTEVQEYVVNELKKESYPFVVVDMILREASLQRNNK